MLRTTLAAASLAATLVPLGSAIASPPRWAPAHGYRAHNGEIAYRRTDNGIRYWQGNDGRYYCRRSNGTTGLLIGGVAGALIGREIDRSSARCR